MKLTRISLVNWYLYNPIDIDIVGNTALIGVNGTGKSTILDAIQTVLFGANMNHVRFNAKASAPGTKNLRDLRSYCLGAYMPETNTGKPLTIRQNDHSYLALSFEGKGKTVNLVLGIEARQDELKVDVRLRAIDKSGRAISCEDFITRTATGYTALPVKDVQEHLHLRGFRFTDFPNSKEYVTNLVRELGPDRQKSGETIDPTTLSTTLSKSLSIGEIDGVSNFVKRFILEDKPLNVESMINARRQYQEILEQIEQDQLRLDKLMPITKKMHRSLRQMKKSAVLYWHHYEQQIEALELQLEELLETRQDEHQKYRVATTRIGEIEKLTLGLNDEIESLVSLIGNNQGMVEFNRLKDAIESLNKDKSRLESLRLEYFNALDGYVHRDFAVLDGHTDLTAINNLKPLSTEADKVNAKKADKLVTELFSNVGDIEQIASSLHYQTRKALEEATERSGQLYRQIEDAEKGKLTLRSNTQYLIEALANKGIEAKPLFTLATITDERWQPAIEALLGGNTEALIVEPTSEVAAYRVYRQLRQEKGRETYNVTIVRTSRGQQWLGKYQSGSAAELVQSDNEHALAYLHNQLGNFILVDTEQDLKKHTRAITDDGMVSSPASTTRKRLPDDLKLITDQRANIPKWKAEREKLEEARLDLDKKQGSLKAIENATHSLAQFLASKSENSFGQFNHEIDHVEEQIQDKKRLQEQIDLTSVQSNEALLKKRKEERRLLGGEKGKLHDAVGTHRQAFMTAIKDYKTIARNRVPKVTLARQAIESSPYFDFQYSDLLSYELQEIEPEQLQSKAADAKSLAGRQFTEAEGELYLYLNDVDKFIDESDVIKEERLEEIVSLLDTQIAFIEENSLARHIESAKRAEYEMNESYRADMINKLKGAFDELSTQFNTINNALRRSHFHGMVYQFRRYPKTEYKDLMDYIKDVSNSDADNAGDLFDNTPESVKASIDQLINGDIEGNTISDYREYFDYDVEIKKKDSETGTTLSKLSSIGSGGERQAPFYVTLASALSTAWKTLKRPGESVGLTLLDEAFNNLSEDNLISAKDYMNDVGLQLVIAAPSDKEPVFSTVMDTIVYISKEGIAVDVTVHNITDKGREVLSKSNPNLNADLVRQKVAEIST